LVTAELFTKLKAVLPETNMKEEEVHPLGNGGKIVVYPTTEEEIVALLTYANGNGKRISVAGAGTKRGFGGLTEQADILLSLSNYKGIVEHTAGDMTVTVRAGTPFHEIQEYLAAYSQKIAVDPSQPERATIGGIIATNESGPKRLGCGSARDAVIGMKVVYPDGKVIRAGGKVVKNVAGYDMNKLFIGSMGTLGVLSEVTLKLRPLPKYESLILLSFPEGELEDIRSFAVRLLDSAMEPSALELLSPSLSERLMNVKHYTLAVSFEDVESSVHYQEQFVKSIQPAGTFMTILPEHEARAFWTSFYRVYPACEKHPAHQETEAVLKIGVVNLDVLHVLRESELLQDTHNTTVEAHGGLGHGLCQVYIKGADEDICSAIHELRAAVTGRGGYVIVKHLSLALRQKVSVWGEAPSSFFLLKGIKEKIDPNNVLNHRRFVGGI
jgi:glycolate oxidase FAD binding subunit